MKRLFYVLIFMSGLCLLLGCSGLTANAKTGDIMNIEYESGVYFSKNWTDSVGTYTGNVIPDKETAVAVATVIFNGMEKSNSYSELVAQNVFYDEQDSIWIVSFWEDGPNGLVAAGKCCSIALRAKDGQVLRIWYGE